MIQVQLERKKNYDAHVKLENIRFYKVQYKGHVTKHVGKRQTID